ncbi:MAG: DUF6632 domain-containing protein [Candidatus Acidiferrales bacterium]
MKKERALKAVLILAGLLFLAGIYPLIMSLWRWQQSDEIAPMFLSLYVTLGLFLLLAARNPSANRALIAFTAWSSLAHAFVMVIQAFKNASGRPDLLGMSAILVVIAVPLIALAPSKPAQELAPAVGA